MSERELSLEDIQQVEFSVLKEVTTICDNLKIKYFLSYGTLLGAVRHHGFIPWDDDVDIIMFRKDRNKLIHYLKTEYKGRLVVCDRESTENYPYGIPRVCDMSYTYVSTNPLENKLFKQGVFLDVYALDPCGNSIAEAASLFKKTRRINFLFRCYLGLGSTNPIKGVIKRIIGWAVRIWKGGDYSKFVDAEIEDIIRRNTDSSNRLIAQASWSGPFCIYEKELFEESCSVTFNGHEFNAPKNYDAVLRISYGDYWTLPPEEKRVPHHNYKIFKNG